MLLLDQPSFQSVLLECQSGGQTIGTATGFVVVPEEHSPILITNWHVEAYRDPRRPHFLGGWGLWGVQVGFRRRCVSVPSGW